MWTQKNVEPGDYVKIGLCECWFKVTDTSDPINMDLVDESGLPTGAEYGDIEDLKLASEMDYAF